ncbi:hypothetical protein [Azohydromonas caseinilytica]|uniref:Uncharacterized protein n=1 Tax=Azohydromonas caseinilytica TaxID=2728836 RepID=A0A848FJU8_9BURK|nr:hypothetical protein [Azohydromonas caseinilytica]NML18513.1 hypothetical protein [Azohydromonas caseinilytica]
MSATAETMAPPAVATRARRRCRAATAARLLAAAPEAAADIEWDVLDAAPAWLALDAVACARLQCRVGALLCQAELRLWIDRPRVAAARAAVGEAFWKALLARPPLPLPAPPRLGEAAQVPERLQALGAAVLWTALPAGLRRAVTPLLAAPAPLELHPEAARQLLAAVETLEIEP